MIDRDQILDALDAFAATRPRLEFGNYGDRSSYRKEVRSITRDLHDARILLAAVRRSSITGAQLIEAFRGKRLQWDGARLDYTTGQYYPVEYRPAVCSVAVSALWAHYARDVTGDNLGDKIRATARRALPRAISKRWFN